MRLAPQLRLGKLDVRSHRTGCLASRMTESSLQLCLAQKIIPAAGHLPTKYELDGFSPSRFCVFALPKPVRRFFAVFSHAGGRRWMFKLWAPHCESVANSRFKRLAV